MHKKITTHLKSLYLLILLAVMSSQLLAQSQPEFLPPQQAYRLSAMSDGPNAVKLTWKITDEYYLYRKKFKFSTDNPDIALGTTSLPNGEIINDEYFGDMEIYRDSVTVQIPLTRQPGSNDRVKIKTVSQGCADAGLCYPPQTEYITVALPTAAADKKAGSALSALSILGQTLGLADEPDILPAEEAYRFSATVETPNQLQLLWQIADGTYLYQDKIKVELLEGDGVSLAPIELPPAEIKKNALRPDGTTGDLPVYHHEINLPVTLIRAANSATDIRLKISYQGCADAGVCYPPIRKNVNLSLPPSSGGTVSIQPLAKAQQALDASRAATTTTATAALPAEPQSELDQITSTLAGGSTWLVVLSFFGFGLLLSLTPCIFPMVPILSGIIAGQGDKITTSKAFTLSMVYVLAMAMTYTLAGVLAGLFGQNLQVAFQNPWILSFFALVFVLLALSMFGFYELQIPSRWQSKISETSNHQRGGSIGGVAIMGFLSALIVGPCVAPPLAAALIYIGQTGDAILGGVALFAMAMGLGAPLIVIGTSAGKLLPRAGAWMDRVKAVFGVGMLAVAIIMLERIIPADISMVLWGTLLVVSAIYMGALRQLQIEDTGWDQLWKGLGFVLLIYGALMLIGAAAGGKDTVQPLRGLFASSGGSQSNHLQFKRIKSVQDLQREVATASAANQPVMLDFYADWCVSCKEMERYTFNDPKVISALNGFVLLQADVTANDDLDQALLQGHFGLPGPPSIMFYGRDGAERKGYRVIGFKNADEFSSHIRNANL